MVGRLRKGHCLDTLASLLQVHIHLGRWKSVRKHAHGVTLAIAYTSLMV